MQVYIPVFPWRKRVLNSSTLLIRRLRENWKHQYGHIKAILDWTVMVYIVVPAIIIGTFIYRSWWIELPTWVEVVPFPFIFVFFFLFLWNGHLITYVREADRIFLMKNESLMLGMKCAGIIYSSVFQFLPAIGIAFLSAPFWFEFYHMSLEQLITLIGLFVSFKWLIMAIRGRLNVHLRGWRSIIQSTPIFIGAIFIWELCYKIFQAEHYVWMLAMILVFSSSAYLLTKRRFKSNQVFDQDLAIDEMEKNKYIGFIFSFSIDMEKLPQIKPVRERPRLYSKSNRLFRKRTAKNGFLELFIKVTTRSSQYLFDYLKIVGITSAAIITLPPIWLKISIALCGAVFLLSWIGTVWNRVVGSHPFTKKYAQEEDFFRAKNIVSTLLVIPFVLLIGISFGIRVWVLSLFTFF